MMPISENINNKQLLKEFNLFEFKKSLDPNTGRLMLSGIMQRADVVNQNGRIYPRDILRREITNYQKFIRENRALGELDHPESSVISLAKVSHIVRTCSMDEDGTVTGTIEILDTPNGQIAKKLVDSGVAIGISSRSIGSVKREGNHDIVQDDLVLIGMDLVSDPSTSGAFLFKENVDLQSIRKILTKSDRLDRILNELI